MGELLACNLIIYVVKGSIMDISAWIDKMISLRNEMCQLDLEKIYNYYSPNSGSTATEIQQVEKELGISLDKQYTEFLKFANGWCEFFQAFSLFGTKELITSPQMTKAKEILGVVYPWWENPEFKEKELLPIAVDETGSDLFVLTPATVGGNSMVLWIAGQEIERYDSFFAFLDAMLEYTKEELDDFKCSR